MCSSLHDYPSPHVKREQFDAYRFGWNEKSEKDSKEINNMLNCYRNRREEQTENEKWREKWILAKN
jgi:hypothetical protein